jgi:outer membrane biosynthesis protein TonB
MWFRSSLLATGLGALALAGCGSGDEAALIPQDNADQLTALVSEAGDASAAGECDRARRAVSEAEAELAGLPRATDRELKANLRDWLEHLDGRIAEECEAPEPEETATPEPTVAPTETPVPTETATPEPEPTETATPEPTVEPEPTVTVDPGTGGAESPEEPASTGGVPPEDDG